MDKIKGKSAKKKSKNDIRKKKGDSPKFPQEKGPCTFVEKDMYVRIIILSFFLDEMYI